MKIDWLIPARYAELSGDGTMSILGGGVDTLIVAQSRLPTDLRVFLAMRIIAPVSEWRDAARSLKVVVAGPTGKQQTAVDDPITIAEASMIGDPLRVIGLLLPTPCRWRASCAGIYSFRVFLDGEVDQTLGVDVIGSHD